MKDLDDLSLTHPPDALLIQAADDELSTAGAAAIDSHLAACQACKRRYQALRQVSAGIESALAASPIDFSFEQRARLERQLEARARIAPIAAPSHLLRRLSSAVAIAAALAFALLYVPHWSRSLKTAGPVPARLPSAFEVDGESFVALPYSNPDLPLNASHIVQMQVPVSSLADAGIVFEPISNEMSSPDRSVLADVLLGMDGRPLGIHVLNAE